MKLILLHSGYFALHRSDVVFRPITAAEANNRATAVTNGAITMADGAITMANSTTLDDPPGLG
jgi:hypothetical protein